MSVYILGISAFYHDSAACLLKDGTLVAAAQEERFTRLKNDARFPTAAIQFCLQQAGIRLREVAHVVFYEKPFLKFERLLETYVAFAPRGLPSFWKSMPSWMKEKLFQKQLLSRHLRQLDAGWQATPDKLLFTEHHQAHAASAYYPSPFAEALVLTVDGVGEWTTTSVAHGRDNALEMLREIRFPHSLGLLYSAFTYYLGFRVNSDEYKVMGLAPYGKPTYVSTIYEHLLDVKADGSFRLNMAYFDYCTGLTMTSRRFDALFGQPPRPPAAALTTFHLDLACSIQRVTEEVLLRLTSQLHQEFGLPNLCLAGGVGLNCVANGRILRESGFQRLWIQPATGDAGGALGAAFAVHHEYLGHARPAPLAPQADHMHGALLGPTYPRAAVKAALAQHGLPFIELDDAEFYQVVAEEIAAGQVVGFFQGRMEFGPRALGARSILGDARRAEMQAVINLKIKFRESFRPFAPVVLEEFAAAYFQLAVPSPYMLLVAPVRDAHRRPPAAKPAQGLDQLREVRSSIPAATHVDYSARIQTVNAHQNPALHGVVTAFHHLTGVPVILNTSFNVRDEPIVCSPEDAIRCFNNSGLDVLAMENCLVKKPL